jgi:hypothetical protein
LFGDFFTAHLAVLHAGEERRGGLLGKEKGSGWPSLAAPKPIIDKNPKKV